MMSEKARKLEVNPQLLTAVSAVRVFVSDLKRALEFYTGPFGLGVSGTDESSWVLVRLANARLLIESVSKSNPDFEVLVGRFTGMTFDTEDIQQAYEKLSALRVKFDMLPEKQFWGGTLAYFRDPDGDILVLVG
jgi:catechol 2,3-dioxygenase-like lactoylglutathione lyase family enzyme